MALYNSESINGFPTGNLSLQLLNKINPQQIHFVNLVLVLLKFNKISLDTILSI